MEVTEIIRRTVHVLRAIEGRKGLDQLSSASIDVLLRVAEAEIAGKAPTSTFIAEGSGEGQDVALSRLAALERAGWLSSSMSTDRGFKQLHLTRRARRAFAATAEQLRRNSL